MKIRALLTGYPPVQGAGAEWYMHSVLRHLKAQGHQVSVGIVGDTASQYPIEYQGIPIDPSKALVRGWADVILTQLGGLPFASRWAKGRTPLVHFNNNDWSWNHAPSWTALHVFNTHWVAERAGVKGVVVYPPVNVSEYQTQPGERITLVNLMAEKGSAIFYKLAERFPDQPFLAVKGGWGRQVIETHPNVVYVENTPNMRDEVYAQTRILLVPSEYESFGRVAVEAACSGIPVLASPTTGLQEAMGLSGAHWVEGRIDTWESALRSHLEGRAPFVGQQGLERAHALEQITAEQLDDLEWRLERIAR